MEKDWVKVYRTTDAFRAEVLKQALVENDIPAVVMNKQDSSYIVFGNIDILVSKSDEVKALQFIEENGYLN